jgi:hypothetical protein
MTTLLINSPVNNFSGPSEVEKGFTGLMPATLTSFVKFENGIGPVFAAFKILNSLTLTTLNQEESLAEIIKNKHLVYISYEKGLVRSVGMHSEWVKVADSKHVSEIALRYGIAQTYEPVKSDFDFVSMDDKSYERMVKKFFP